MLCLINSNRLSVVAAAIFSIGILSTQTFAGDGRNGPQTSGDAIPVQVDRVLTVNDLVKVAHACDFKLINKLYTQIFKIEDPSLEVYYKTFKYSNEDHANRKQLLTTTIAGTSSSNQIEVGINSVFGSEIEINLPKEKDVELVTGTSQRTIRPHFVFDAEVSESSYDELGRLLESRVFVKNPIIALPRTGLKPFNRFYNRDTGKLVPVEVNVEEYAMCLLSGIQKKD